MGNIKLRLILSPFGPKKKKVKPLLRRVSEINTVLFLN